MKKTIIILSLFGMIFSIAEPPWQKVSMGIAGDLISSLTFENNNISKNETRDSILNVIKNHKLIPDYFNWHNPSKRCTPEFGFAGFIRLYLWCNYFR